MKRIVITLSLVGIFAAAFINDEKSSTAVRKTAVNANSASPCKIVDTPDNVTDKVPDWEIKPNMLLYETKPSDKPYPSSTLSYTVWVRNLGAENEKNVKVYIGNDLFGWERMYFDTKSEAACPELQPNQFNSWVWSHGWHANLDPSWRSTMEKSAQLRFVWEDSEGWHQVQGHLPSQYYSQSFRTSDLKPLTDK